MSNKENQPTAEVESDFSNKKTNCLFSSEFNQLSEKSPTELLIFIVNNRSYFSCLFKENDTEIDLMSSRLIILGKACEADYNYCKMLNNLMRNLSSNINQIVKNIERYLVVLNEIQMLDKQNLNALFYLTIILKTFQLTIHSAHLNSIYTLLPLISSICDKNPECHKDLRSNIVMNLNLIKKIQKQFFENRPCNETQKEVESKSFYLQEPLENFKSLSILPTNDDIDGPCLFLRPNIVKGRYKDVEHYLDVQFRLLREDYIKPFRDGVAEYKKLKQTNQSFKRCEHVRIYCNVLIHSEEFVDGDLLHVLKFQDKYFSAINWKSSKRFLTGNLLCLSTNDFFTKLFAIVVDRNPQKLKKGLLYVKFVEMDDKIWSIDLSVDYVVIEVSTLFEAYRHNLKVLQQLNENSLPMKNYIVSVEKTVNRPQYLQSTTVFDMRPLLLPIEESFKSCNKSILGKKQLKFGCNVYCKSVQVINEKKWPKASELRMDESQYIALKSAITKEFAIIQGPPGTGKTYVGLRIVQLLLHNLDVWFNDKLNCLPILIVCYTNHALDQFLEGISKFTNKIVRIGGCGTNEAIAKFQIKNLVRYNMKCRFSYRKRVARNTVNLIKERISSLDAKYYFQSNIILRENILKDYIPRIQYNSLITDNSTNNSKRTIYAWLEIDSFNDFQSTMNHYEEDDLTYSNDVENEEFEIEEEADIEFIENLRNIDYYDFSDKTVLRKNSRSYKKECQYPMNYTQTQVEYIKNSFQNNPVMDNDRALRVRNIWMLSLNERWQLYKFWLECFYRKVKQDYASLQNDLKIAVNELSNARTEEDLWVLADAQVVGMTTTGAAKYRHIIEARNPVILIVEEAAEILESHIVTSLTSKTKHVILIGDQQQLRPSPTVYELAVKYGMDISLFERMILNGMSYSRLSVQHRMRPEIASLIAPHIYPDLENHEIVTTFENIKGINKNMFFVSHDFEELHVQDSKSKVNEHEARFLIKLCKYIIHQGYDPSQITVLTTYSGQLFILKSLAKDNTLCKVNFTVVDSFQGEENDIILISFVRSNLIGNIGFLKVSNRVCVALSRAKKGLYCIGNFDLLAQKSDLWKKIYEILTAKEFIGSSLNLVCQNHPDVFNNVANDSDFDAVPEGGCNRMCEFSLQCGHSCTLFCHPYDKEHKMFSCKQPCMKICIKGHLCPKKCFENCKPCPIIVEKYLSKCGHTVSDLCGINEWEIRCFETCKELCEEGHPCPKMCYEKCDPCTVKVDKMLPECMHTVQVACWESKSTIRCENQCNKTCSRNHPCLKKCFEDCGPCKVKVEKTLDSCGHTLMTECSTKEYEIQCLAICKRILPCSHQCKKKCYERCEEKCLQLVEIRSPVCGHSFKVECCFTDDAKELARKCYVSCKSALKCGHLCKGTCGICKQRQKHVVCNESCEKKLPCGHPCLYKCGELCVINCNKIIELPSSVCGHLLSIKCYLSDNLNALSKRCLNPCKKLLPCNHICTGTCGSCFQGRLHVPCNNICNRTLICGHKCEEKCSISCPPCKKPCKNRCIHKKCPNKCGNPCEKCVKPCNWNCIHKKCSRRCYEVCDRDPCNVRCLKKLSCGHQCAGFCGEPCSQECFACIENTIKKKYSSLKNEETFRYIYLEDCKHTFKEDDLRKWFASTSSRLYEIKLKSCPKCGTIIRVNFRYNKIIKSCLSDVEKIKQMINYDKNKNLSVQRNLLTKINESYLNVNYSLKSVIKILSGGHIRDIYELRNFENIINIVKEIEQKTYNIHSELTPLAKKLVIYMRSSREWMVDFIQKNFLSVSEYQLQQLSVEVYRLNLLDFLLKTAEEKRLVLSPEYENCVSTLLKFEPLCYKNVRSFETQIQSLRINSSDMPLRNHYPLIAISMSGQWYRCTMDHIICFSYYHEKFKTKDCYECERSSSNKKI